MARPTKQGLDYFPFDVDFFADEKINAVSWEFGIKGEITAVKLLCAVYRNGYFIEWTEKLKFKLLKELPGISPDLLDQIVKRLVKWDFFDKNLFDSANILSSKGIQRRYLSIRNKTKRGNNMLKYNLIDNSNMNQCDDRPNAKIKPLTPISNAQQTQPFPSPAVEVYAASFFEEVQRMAKDDVWIEQGVCMKLHIEKSEIQPLLQQFLAHCVSYCSEYPHKSYGDAQRHFIRWFASDKSKSNNNSNKPQSSPDYAYSGGFGGEDT